MLSVPNHGCHGDMKGLVVSSYWRTPVDTDRCWQASGNSNLQGFVGKVASFLLGNSILSVLRQAS